MGRRRCFLHVRGDVLSVETATGLNLVSVTRGEVESFKPWSVMQGGLVIAKKGLPADDLILRGSPPYLFPLIAGIGTFFALANLGGGALNWAAAIVIGDAIGAALYLVLTRRPTKRASTAIQAWLDR